MAYLLRLVAYLFLCVSLNSFGAIFALTGAGTYQIDPTTGDSSEITNQGDWGAYIPNSYGGALAAVPLPAGIYLFLSGLVGLALMRGRRSNEFTSSSLSGYSLHV